MKEILYGDWRIEKGKFFLAEQLQFSAKSVATIMFEYWPGS